MKRIEMTLPIEPRGQGRIRIASIGGHARAYKAKADIEHERFIALAAEPYRKGFVIAGPVRLEVDAIMPRPKTMCGVSKRTGQPLQDPKRKHHTSKPDADNIAKSVMDALKQWWKDDCQIQYLVVSKQIAAFGEEPHYRIVVEELWTPSEC
jgi:Holliday junction resolvase RusA-like endonuclease